MNLDNTPSLLASLLFTLLFFCLSCNEWPAYLYDNQLPPKPPKNGNGNGGSQDKDGDGYTADEGDCDDNDSDIHPDAEDICDYIDNDCDGNVDEDTRYNDPTEPNDSGKYLGILEDTTYNIYGLLHSEEDYDFFTFYVHDSSWSSSFYIYGTLSDIPDNTDYFLWLTLYYEEEDEWYMIKYSDQDGNESEYIYYDESMYDQEGLYGFYIATNYGYDCINKYSLEIDVGS